MAATPHVVVVYGYKLPIATVQREQKRRVCSHAETPTNFCGECGSPMWTSQYFIRNDLYELTCHDKEGKLGYITGRSVQIGRERSLYGPLDVYVGLFLGGISVTSDIWDVAIKAAVNPSAVEDYVRDNNIDVGDAKCEIRVVLDWS